MGPSPAVTSWSEARVEMETPIEFRYVNERSPALARGCLEARPSVSLRPAFLRHFLRPQLRPSSSTSTHTYNRASLFTPVDATPCTPYKWARIQHLYSHKPQSSIFSCLNHLVLVKQTSPPSTAGGVACILPGQTWEIGTTPAVVAVLTSVAEEEGDNQTPFTTLLRRQTSKRAWTHPRSSRLFPSPRENLH